MLFLDLLYFDQNNRLQLPPEEKDTTDIQDENYSKSRKNFFTK